MPKNKTYTRHITGAYLESQYKQNAALILNNEHVKSQVGTLLTTFNKSFSCAVKVMNEGGESSETNQSKSNKKVKIKYQVNSKNSNILNSKNVTDKINNLSSNVAVRKKAHEILKHHNSLDFNPIFWCLDKKGPFFVRDTKVIMTVEQGDNDDVFITKTVKKEIFSTETDEAITHNFYTVSTVLHIAPTENSENDGKQYHNSNCSIESIEETVDTSSLESNCLSLVKQYISAQQLISSEHFENVKQVFSGLSFDQEKFRDKFKGTIIFLADRNDVNEHDIDVFFNQFTTLQLVKIHRAIQALKADTQEKEDLIKIAKKIGDILVARKVSPYLIPNKTVYRPKRKELKENILQIKNCLTSSYLVGRNINLLFTRSNKIELAKLINKLSAGLIIGINELTRRDQITSNIYYPDIKNRFIYYFKSSELCELYKKISEVQKLLADHPEQVKINFSNEELKYDSNGLTAVKEVICCILEEREISKKYCNYESIDTVQKQNSQSGDDAKKSAATISPT